MSPDFRYIIIKINNTSSTRKNSGSRRVGNNLWGPNVDLLQAKYQFLTEEPETVAREVQAKIDRSGDIPKAQHEPGSQKKNYSVFRKRARNKQSENGGKEKRVKNPQILEETLRYVKSLLAHGAIDLQVPIEIFFKWSTVTNMQTLPNLTRYLERYTNLRALYFAFKMIIRRIGLESSNSQHLSSYSVFLMTLSFLQNEEYSQLQANPHMMYAYTNYYKSFGSPEDVNFRSLTSIPLSQSPQTNSGIRRPAPSSIRNITQFNIASEQASHAVPVEAPKEVQAQKKKVVHTQLETSGDMSKTKGVKVANNSASPLDLQKNAIKLSNPLNPLLAGESAKGGSNVKQEKNSSNQMSQGFVQKKIQVNKNKKKLSAFSNSFAHPQMNTQKTNKNPKIGFDESKKAPDKRKESFKAKLKKKWKKINKNLEPQHWFQANKQKAVNQRNSNLETSILSGKPTKGETLFSKAKPEMSECRLQEESQWRLADHFLRMVQFYGDFNYESLMLVPRLEYYLPCFPFSQKTDTSNKQLRIMSPFNPKFITTQNFVRTTELKAKLRLVSMSFYMGNVRTALDSSPVTLTMDRPRAVVCCSPEKKNAKPVSQRMSLSRKSLFVNFDSKEANKIKSLRSKAEFGCWGNQNSKKKAHLTQKTNCSEKCVQMDPDKATEIEQTSLEIECEKKNQLRKDPKSSCASKKSFPNFKIELKSPPILHPVGAKPRPGKRNKEPSSGSKFSKYSSLKIIHKKQSSSRKMDVMKSYESIRSIKEKMVKSGARSLLKKAKRHSKTIVKPKPVKQLSSRKTEKFNRGNADASGEKWSANKMGRAKDGSANQEPADLSPKKEVSKQFKFLHLFKQSQLIGFKHAIPEQVFLKLNEAPQLDAEEPDKQQRLSSVFRFWDHLKFSSQS